MGKTYRYDDGKTSKRRNQTEISRARARKTKNRNVLFEENRRKETLLEIKSYTLYKEPKNGD